MANVVRVEIQTEDGARVAARYGIEFTPSFVIFDRSGRQLQRLVRVDSHTGDTLRSLAGSSGYGFGTMDGG